MRLRAVIFAIAITAGSLAITKTVQAAAPVAGIFSASGNRLATLPQIPAGASVVSSDLDGNGAAELVVGSPAGVPTTVSIFSLDGTLIRSFPVFSSKSRAGVNVTVGDFQGNGFPNIVVALRRGAGPQILSYTPTGRKIDPGFFAYVKNFRGGVNLTSGDVDGDGKDEIITAAGPGGGPHVAAFRPNGTKIYQIFPYDQSFRSGLSIAAFDYDKDGRDDIVAAPQTGRQAIVTITRVYDRHVLASFPVLGGFSGGVSLSVNTIGLTPKILIGAGAGGGPQVVQYDPATGKVNGVSMFPFTTRWRGGVFPLAVDQANDGTPEYAAFSGGLYVTPQRMQQYGHDVPASSIPGANYEQRRLNTAVGAFTVDIISADLATPGMKLKTVTSTPADCLNDCPVHPLQYYIDQAGGFAGINGSYFCPLDTASCADTDGSYFWMWFNSVAQSSVNVYQNQFNTGPLVAFDTLNRAYLFNESKLFPGEEGFETTNGVTLQALLSNDPWLVLNSAYAVDNNRLDTKQRSTRAVRGGVGMRGTTIYFFHAKSATVPDLGRVADALDLDWAINLDGGGSSALAFDGTYHVGPGRGLPNAIVLTNK